MEAVGVALDREALAVLDREFGAEISRLEAEIYADVGHEFNLGSPKQLEQILFFELNLPKGKRTKTGYSTDASVLEELRPAHPMIDKLLEWRIYTKLRSTYVEALPTLIAADGRLHTTFHQAVAATGRLSSSDPNLQNIPIRTAARAADPAGVRGRRAGPRRCSPPTTRQIELRILAHVSGDEHLKDAFAREADIHRETAARVLHKAPEDITAGERSMAKMVNFGLAYGMSDFGLASRANIPRKEAQEFINTLLRGVLRDQLLHDGDQGAGEDPGLRRDAARPEAPDPGAAGAQPGAARRRRADGDQHADPGDGRRHPEDRDDPGRRAARAPTGFRARLLLRSTTSCCFEVPRDEVEPARRRRPRDDGGRAAADGAARSSTSRSATTGSR